MRFHLRSLVLVVTAICLGLGFYVYRLSQRGHFGIGTTVEFGQSDAAPIAHALRDRISALPGHAKGAPFELSSPLFTAEQRLLSDTKLTDRFFYRVTLSDGSVTRVGFWVHERPRVYWQEDAPQETWVTYAIYAHDSFRSGPADARRRERWNWKKTYDGIILKTALEAKYAAAR